MTTFYYITPAEDGEHVHVQSTGIIANGAGKLRLFTDLAAANAIARDMLCTSRYAVFRVAAAGITAKPRADKGKEVIRRCQWLIRQRRIEARHLAVVGVFDTVRDRPTDWDYSAASTLGMSKGFLDALFDAREWAREQCRVGRLTEEQIVAELGRRFTEAAEREAKAPDETLRADSNAGPDARSKHLR